MNHHLFKIKIESETKKSPPPATVIDLNCNKWMTGTGMLWLAEEPSVFVVDSAKGIIDANA